MNATQQNVGEALQLMRQASAIGHLEATWFVDFCAANEVDENSERTIVDAFLEQSDSCIKACALAAMCTAYQGKRNSKWKWVIKSIWNDSQCAHY